MTSSSGGSPSGASPRDSRATTWMVIAGILALVAIGLGIWAFTTKSDLDDANATIEQQERQLAAEQQGAQSEEARLEAFGDRERAAFRRVRRRFIREEAEARNLQAKIQKEAGELDEARNQASSAEAQEQQVAADLKQARQAAQLSAVCVQGAVHAIDRFFDASSAKVGANEAVAELESIQEPCTKANE